MVFNNKEMKNLEEVQLQQKQMGSAGFFQRKTINFTDCMKKATSNEMAFCLLCRVLLNLPNPAIAFKHCSCQAMAEVEAGACDAPWPRSNQR